MPTSNPRIKLADPLKNFRLTVFYLKTWICPNNTIFNPSTNMCVTCTIANCVTCHNLTNCSICNQAANYFLNPLTGLCEISAIPGCLTFTNLTACSGCD